MKLKFDPRLVTDIIGKGNYTQFRSIIDEYIANAWDAEAKKIDISIPADFDNSPIVIRDDGTGIDDIDHFIVIGANVQLKKQVTQKFRRNIIGKKGIGRFAGFACAEQITYKSRTKNHTIEIKFDRKELLKHELLEEVEIPIEIIEEENSETGTTVTISLIDGDYRIPTVESIEKDLLLDFGIISDFTIYINGNELKKTQIPGEVFEYEETNAKFGHVKGNILVANNISKKQKPGIIIRVKNRRVEGPEFFGIEDSFSTKITNRIYGDFNADGLEDIISSGREAFIQHDEKYQELIEWIKQNTIAAANKIQEKVDVKPEDIIFNLPSFQNRIKRLPDHLQKICREYVKKIGPKLNRIKHDTTMLEIFGLLILRASENSDFYSVLVKIEQAENMDITSLTKVLERWGVGEIAHASFLAQNRITILNKFAEIVNNDSALELQDLHKILETSTWILDDRYTLFSSNEGLRKIVDRLGDKYEGANGRKRPDLILKRDREDLVLIELKAPSVTVTLAEVAQALEYQQEIMNYQQDARDMDVYIVGREFDPISRGQYFEGNPQRVHLLSLNTILQQAQDRLNWLHQHLRDEYNYIKSQYVEDEEILPEAIAR